MSESAATIDTLEIELVTKSTDVTKALEKLNKTLSKLSTSVTPATSSVDKINKKLTTLQSIASGASNALGRTFKTVLSFFGANTTRSFLSNAISESNEYVESLNLFTVALGNYAEEAENYAETVSEIMGIDPAEWLKAQGVFQTITTGFGVVEDRAYTMSKNLTQLSYDLSSFFNLDVEDAITKLTSGISGKNVCLLIKKFMSVIYLIRGNSLKRQSRPKFRYIGV